MKAKATTDIEEAAKKAAWDRWAAAGVAVGVVLASKLWDAAPEGRGRESIRRKLKKAYATEASALKAAKLLR